MGFKVGGTEEIPWDPKANESWFVGVLDVQGEAQDLPDLKFRYLS